MSTPEAQALVDLAERCEAATGGSRAIDEMIAAAVQDMEQARTGKCPRLWVKPFSTSLDAALTLLNGIGVLLHISDIGADGLPLAVVGNPGAGGEFKGVGARTLPLALCAASLRALSLIEATHGEGGTDG